ncbi:unnamed protein product [Linum trigynum]|uniref:Uncharacterized protein n=1 Tax=Linum trigynum TaxID=586398 RepID=A0AAV2DXF1_9ROSI
MLGPCEEIQDDPIEEIACRLALQSVLEEEERARVRKEVVEDEEESKEEFLIFSKGRYQILKKEGGGGGGVEEAIGVQTEDEVEVEEACTGPMLHVLSPPNFEEMLGKDPFAVLFARPRAHQHRSLLVNAMVVNRWYLIWFGSMRQEKPRRRGLECEHFIYFISLKGTSHLHHLSHHLLVT